MKPGKGTPQRAAPKTPAGHLPGQVAVRACFLARHQDPAHLTNSQNSHDVEPQSAWYPRWRSCLSILFLVPASGCQLGWTSDLLATQRPPCSVSCPVPLLLVCASDTWLPAVTSVLATAVPGTSRRLPPPVLRTANKSTDRVNKRVSPSSRFSAHKRYRDAGGHRTGRRPAGSHGRDCSAQAHAWLWTH